MPSQHPFAELVGKPFPELAAALRAQSAQIIDIFVTEVRKAIPSLGGLSDRDLKDNLPNILSGMADYLSAANDARKLVEESPLKGLSRFQKNYDVRALMHEDRLFRRIVIERCDAGLKRRMSQEEQISLDMGIDVMLQQAVVAFVGEQDDRIRAGAESEIKHLSFLSHDLKNNLGSVTIFLKVLRERLAGFGEFAQEVATLDQTQEAIANTIDGMGRLLQNERLRNAGVTVKVLPVNLHRLASHVTQPLARQAEQAGLRFAFDIPLDAIVKSDGELITLVLQNILGNAIKYSTKGIVRISAKQRREANDTRWVLEVADDGPGIAKECLQGIFAAFKQGDSHGQMGGVGLGLAIASQAANLMGAELLVKSTVGVGSRFILVLAPDPDTASIAIGMRGAITVAGS